MIRPRLLVLPLLLVPLLAGCGDDGAPAAVAGLRLMDGGRVEVVVESSRCSDPGDVGIEESRSEVTLEATTVQPDDDCEGTAESVYETTRIRLTSPVGDRAVVDASTGEEVPYVVCDDEPDHPLCTL